MLPSFSVRFAGTCVALALAGCVPLATVENLQHAPPSPGIEVSSAAVVRSAIERAARETGWTVAEDSGSRMLLRRSEKRRAAVLAVAYDANQYGLRYHDSEGFAYRWSPVADYGGTIINGERGRVHKDYNAWVMALDRAIQAELTGSVR